MLKLVARRLLLSVGTLLIVSVLIFGATELLPGDAATAILGREATPETLQRLRAELELDRPALARYADWLGGIFRGDLGTSSIRGEPISELVSYRAVNTLLLAAVAAAVGLPLALALGVVGGLLRDRMPDFAISTVALIGMSLPEFVVGTLLIWAFSLSLGIFPATTTVAPDAPIPELLPNLVLPAATLAIVMVAYVLRMTRTSLIDAMASDYVRMATLKGLSPAKVVSHHALPNALLPTINAVALTVGWLLGGVVVVEVVFNYPGVGGLMVSAVEDRDLPLVQALALLSAAAYILCNLTADLLALLLNPRLRALRG